MRTQGFFEEVEKLIQKQDPFAKVLLAGGSIRNLFGFLHQELYELWNEKEGNVFKTLQKAKKPFLMVQKTQFQCFKLFISSQWQMIHAYTCIYKCFSIF